MTFVRFTEHSVRAEALSYPFVTDLLVLVEPMRGVVDLRLCFDPRASLDDILDAVVGFRYWCEQERPVGTLVQVGFMVMHL